jgi:transcriptional regulator with XRE-family HTH domain
MKELGYKQRAIAEIFGVTRSAIANVLCGITWKDVPDVE